MSGGFGLRATGSLALVLSLCAVTAGCQGEPAAGRAGGVPTNSTISASKVGNGMAVSKDCLVTGDDGYPQWFADGPPFALQSLALELQAVVDSHQNEATGVVYCSHYDGVVVTLPAQQPNGQVIEKVNALAKSNPQYPVTIVYVPASWQALTDAAASLYSSSELKPLVIEALPKTTEGQLDIKIDRTYEKSAQGEGLIRKFLDDHGYVNLPIIVTLGVRSQDSWG